MKIPFFQRKKPSLRATNPHFMARDARRARRLSLLMLIPPLVAAFLIGAVSGLGDMFLLTLAAGAIFAALAMMVVNTNVFLHLMFWVVFVIHGSAMYFGGILTARWVATGMGILFVFRVLMDMALRRRHQANVSQDASAGTGVLICTLVYLAAYAGSVLMNRPGTGQLFSAVKNNLPMFGVLATFFWFYWKPEQIEKLWKVCIWVLLIQLPVTFYQHFFIMSQRANGWDSVVGTFGGTPLVGGLSWMAAFFVILTMGYVLACWNRGIMRGKTALWICLAGLGVIMLGEVKAAFLWLPFVVFLVLRKRILKNMVTAISFGLLTVTLLGGIYAAYKTFYWADTTAKARQYEDQELEDSYFFDPNNVNYRTGEVGRGASLAIWIDDRAASLPTRLIGYGPGAVKAAGPVGGGGPVARRHAPLSIDATAVANLLWDVGLVGALAYTGIIVSGILTGWRYIRRGEGSARQLAMAEASTAALCVFFTMLIYNRTLLDEPTVQLLFMFCLGCVVQLARYRVADATAPLPESLVVKEPPRAPVMHGVPIYTGR